MKTAAELDAADPLGAYPEKFIKHDGVASYLDGNSLGRPLADTPERLRRFVEDTWGERLIRAWDESWMDEPTRLGDQLARVCLGAAAGQTVVADSTSVMLYKALRAALDANPDRTEIVLDRDNFPTDRFIIEGIAAERGATLVWIEPDPTLGVSEDQVRDALNSRTAVVLLSHVAYRSGYIADGAGITAAVHEAGALMLWDLCHSVGSVPLALDEWGADLAVGCTYKYLNGGPGAPAFGYVNRSLQGHVRQPIWGWMGAADPFGMSPSYVPAGNVRQFISGTPPILGMQPLGHMLELVEAAGMEAIRAKSVALTSRALELIEQDLVPLGVEVASPRSAPKRGSHVTINHSKFRDVTALLWERGVIPDFRPPHGLRIGLSPLSTTFTEVDAGIEAIRVALVEVSER